MNRRDFRFFHRLRVRWAEVDMQKIVFNAHYLMYFDTAVADYWRAIALPYEEAMQQLGGDLYVKKATVEFNASARMDDRLDIGMKCSRVGNSSMVFTGAIFRDNELLITCELVYVFADPVMQKSKHVPAALRELLLGFEAGEDVLDVRVGSWADLREPARRIRTEVFVEEQRVPLEMEWDEADESCLHAVVFNRIGQAVGTGRLLPSQGGSAKIGRVAVNKVLRGSGVGQRVMAALMDTARQRGDKEIVLHAQRTAESFYRGLGYTARGDEFEEAGIPHIEMTRSLATDQMSASKG
jgi:YbgC/YbaW family acyl-CoA thioester hydrolase